jgi:tetratricopeptide (TPR) repeat protein
MRTIVIYTTVALAVPAFAFIDEDPGLYAEEFSIQIVALGAALDDLGAILEQAVAGDIDEHEGELRTLRSDFDGVYNKISEWEKIPDGYTLCTAGLEESAINAGESADELLEYVSDNDNVTLVRAAMKYEEAFEAFSKALDTYPYMIDEGE